MLTQPDARGQKAGRNGTTEQTARALADPTTGHREGEEERKAEHDGNAAGPGQDATAEQFLDVWKLERRPSLRNGRATPTRGDSRLRDTRLADRRMRRGGGRLNVAWTLSRVHGLNLEFRARDAVQPLEPLQAAV